MSNNWEELVQDVMQVPLHKLTSDTRHRRNLCDPFRFENMWLKATKFEYRVNEWWNRYDVTGIPSFRLEKKLKIPAYLYK